jgi:hypothetical protein
MKNSAFARAKAIFATIAALGSLHSGAALAAAMDSIPIYQSRGKGGKRPQAAGGIARDQRTAVKRKNVQRNRRAHRG